MRKISIDNYERVSKATARKLFNNGDIVYFCPVNLRPGKPFSPEVAQVKTFITFDHLVDIFEFHNCFSCETGKYTAFYIKNKEEI